MRPSVLGDFWLDQGKQKHSSQHARLSHFAIKYIIDLLKEKKHKKSYSEKYI